MLDLAPIHPGWALNAVKIGGVSLAAAAWCISAGGGGQVIGLVLASPLLVGALKRWAAASWRCRAAETLTFSGDPWPIWCP